MPPTWFTHEISVDASDKPWKQFVGEACPHGKKLVLVDGTYVRNQYDSDFSQGGNGHRYRFIPRGEIWIDSNINPEEHAFIAFHECQEIERMRTGISYNRAHDQAKHLEDAFRHQQTKKQTNLRGKTRALASKYIAEEMETKKYPRAQAIAIGISRAKSKTKKTAHKK
jgi:hypothetical protein